MSLALVAPPPLSSHQLLLFLVQLALLLVLALTLGRLALRCGLPAVVGELLTGVLLGPTVLGTLAPSVAGALLPVDAEQMHLLDAVGQLGVLLLVAVAGAHLDTGLLRRRRARVASIGLTGLLVPLGLGVAAGFLMPEELLVDRVDRTTFALFLGVALSVSAIPVIAKTLSDMKLLHRDVGQLTLASAALDDCAAWFMLSVVSAMSVGGLRAGSVALALVSLVGFTLVVLILGRPVISALLRRTARSPEAMPTTAVVVALVLVCAAASQALELEPLLGAFLVGVLIGRPGVVDPARLAPLRTVVLGVLAPLFLALAGLRIDLTALVDRQVLLFGGATLLVAVVGKFAGAYLGARLSRMSHWEGLAIGAGMNSRGVVEVVLATAGVRLGILSTAMYTVIVLIAVCTSVMAPPLLRWSMRRVEHGAEERLREERLTTWSLGAAPAEETPAANGGPGRERRAGTAQK
ncbi:cation:proton antiporter [Streptomyces sp. NBC_00441]|uniref:cation:proton antiporter n=1 Tax=Streptomyces sp. NBC_00441 TaxID=2975742 RepID=UPI002E2E0ABB|nr:cation:proton antiporter [Streptomyces sp. NBC_00441]